MRPYTLEEVKQIAPDSDVFLERYMHSKIILTAVTITEAKNFGIGYYWDAGDYSKYNILWRMWPSRPSDEERKQYKWEKETYYE